MRQHLLLPVIGLLALAPCVGGFWSAPEQAFGAYLAAFWFWLGLSLGSLSLLLLLRLIGGSWGPSAQPLLAAATRTLPLMALLFLPLLGGLTALYPWMQPARLADDLQLQQQQAWLNAPAYLLRTGLCFVVWIGLASRLRKQDVSPGVAASGALLQLATVTLATVDCQMSLQPEYSSTAFGLISIASQMLAAMAGLLLLLPIHATGRRDAAGVLLTLVLAWSYLQLMDYLTAWIADLPPEVAWYLPRTRTSWHWLAAVALLLQSVLPFVLLLSRRLRGGAGLKPLALLMLVGNLAEIGWRVRPAQQASGFDLGIYDLSALIGIGAWWLAVFGFPFRFDSFVPAPAAGPLTASRSHG